MLLKQILSQSITYIIRNLNQLDRKVTAFKFNPNPSKFEDLSPKIEDGKDDQYEEMLLWALKNKRVTNIALTGPYGSGKSSILRYFEDNHKEFNFLNISLASFDDSQIVDDKERNLVEWSILQQMFYLVKGSDIPDSRFKRIRTTSKPSRTLNSILLMIWALSGICILFPNFFCRFVGWENFYVAHQQIIQFSSILIFLFGTFLLIFFSFRTFKGSKFNKLNLTSAEIGLAPELDSSILNKHLDEIIYFFQATKFDTVIIEDLDRFNDSEIFTKLREINTVINCSRQINRRIVFIYAVKDDIFKDKTRTKFFEFIIPVIPIINYSNSAGKLIEELNRAEITDISESFVIEITLFIDDMRLLKNVVNEYQVYKNKIVGKLNPEILFAIIIYKNLFPEDFAKLHEKKGALHTAFKQKPSYISNLLAQFDEDIAKLEKEIENLNYITLETIEELRLVYIGAILTKLPPYTSLVINNQRQSLDTLKGDDGFKSLKLQNPIRYNVSEGYSGTTSGFSFSTVESEINLKKYDQREKEIKLKNEQYANKLRLKLRDLKKDKTNIQRTSLKGVISKIGSEPIETELKNGFLKEQKFEIVRNIPTTDQTGNDKIFTGDLPSKILYPDYEILIFMLRNGFIDEMYQSYISYFHPGAITHDDMDFVLSVKTHKALAIDFELEKIPQLIKLLHVHEFELTETLNISLLDWLLPNRDKSVEVFDAFFTQLSDGSKTSQSFIDIYLTDGKHIPIFMQIIAAKWKELWKTSQLNEDFSYERKLLYLELLLSHASIQDLVIQNEDSLISDFIADQKDFLILSKEWASVERMELIITKLEVYFKDLTIDEEVEKIFTFIYEGWHYSLTLEMITVIIENKNTLLLDNDLLSANYSTIQSSDCVHLKDYVDDYLESYINEVFLAIEENTEETEEAIVSLLNKSLDDNLKESIIKKQNTLIEDLNKVPQQLWAFLLDENKVVPKWRNLQSYYAVSTKPDEHMLSYLNNDDVFSELGISEMDKEIDGIAGFSKAILLWNDIDDNSYHSLSQSFPYHYTENLDFSKLSGEKVQSLIENDIIKLSADNYNLLAATFVGLHIVLIIKYLDEFLDNHNDYVLESDDYKTILEDAEVDIDNKLKLIATIDPLAFAIKFDLAKEICEILINTNNKTNVIMLQDLMVKELTDEQKLRLLVLNMRDMQVAELKFCLAALGNSYGDITKLNHRPTFEGSELNIKLLQFLDEIKFHPISKIKPIEHGRYQVFTKMK